MKVYNTLSRQKEDFKPIDPKNVRVYACGPTVWNYAHIGNGRAAVVFDLLVRVLRHVFGKDHVRYVRNITDVDDKIMKAATDSGEPISAITEKFTRIYNEDMGALGVLSPDIQPRATEHIPGMIAMIEKLIKAGHAYEAQGHVLFNVPSFKEYGALSRRNRDDMVAGARVEVAPYKKDPADFVLWKPSTADQPGWDSPWGRGRPGWHLECSAMNEAINGAHFDIHAGGEDLIFPHHENEIAQSVCAHGGKPYVNYWMHNGMLNIDAKKMSKSLGNVFLVHDMIKDHQGEVIRMMLLSAHYRQPLDWTEDGLMQVKHTLDRYYGLLRDTSDVKTVAGGIPAGIIEALTDDLNTPKAFAEIAQISKQLSTAANPQDKARFKADLLAAGGLLGLLQQNPESWFQAGAGVDEAEITRLIAARLDAKKAKDFAQADKIRAELAAKGILIEDTPQGTKWKKAG